MDLFKLVGKIIIENEEAIDGLEEAKRGAKDAGQAFENTGSKVEKLSNGFTVLKGAAADLLAEGFQKLCSAMGEFVTDGYEYSKQIENYATSFEVMTGSEEKAIEMTQKLQEIGASTPFELPQLADTTQLLMNYGFTADEAIGKMTMLGDISQGNSEKLSRIATAYGQMSSAGKVSLEDIKQMIEAGFNPLQEISESTGESMESLYSRISEGTISIDEITGSMVRSTSVGGKYFGSMEKQSKTLDGRLSTLKDTANESISNILAPLLQQLSDEWLPKVTDAVSKVDEKFTEFSNWISEHQGLILALGTVIGIVTTALTAHSVVQAVQIAMNAAEVTSLGALIAAKAASAAATLAAIAPYVLITAAIAAVIAIIVLCVKHWDEIKAKTIEVATAMAEKWEEIKEAITEKVASMLATVTSKFQEIVATISSKVNDAKSKAQEAFENIRSTIEEKVSSAHDKVSTTFNNIKDAITEKIEAARDAVKNAIDKIKSFFDFEWSLPKLKLPHITITGEWGFNPPRYPTFGIEWYAKGGIMKDPTAFGINGNNLMVGGEAGEEAIAPIDLLQGYVAEAVASQNAGLIEALDKIREAIVAMDENMGGHLSEALDDTSFKINNREFGRLVRGVT